MLKTLSSKPIDKLTKRIDNIEKKLDNLELLLTIYVLTSVLDSHSLKSEIYGPLSHIGYNVSDTNIPLSSCCCSEFKPYVPFNSKK